MSGNFVVAELELELELDGMLAVVLVFGCCLVFGGEGTRLLMH